MPAGGNSRTRVTLLGRLRADPTDQHTWAEFVDHYGPRIVTWCRTWDLQDADAQDVAQTVLLKLATTLRDFAYDPSRSFRAWLKTVAHHAWLDFLKARLRAGQGSGDSRVLDRLHSVEVRDDLLGHLNAAFDQERTCGGGGPGSRSWPGRPGPPSGRGSGEAAEGGGRAGPARGRVRRRRARRRRGNHPVRRRSDRARCAGAGGGARRCSRTCSAADRKRGRRHLAHVVARPPGPPSSVRVGSSAR